MGEFGEGSSGRRRFAKDYLNASEEGQTASDRGLHFVKTLLSVAREREDENSPRKVERRTLFRREGPSTSRPPRGPWSPSPAPRAPFRDPSGTPSSAAGLPTRKSQSFFSLPSSPFLASSSRTSSTSYSCTSP